MQPPTHDVHAAIRESCTLLVNLAERMQADFGPLKPAPGTTWQREIDQFASALEASPKLRERVRSCLPFAAASLLNASLDYAKGMAHAIAGGSLYSGDALARCVAEGIGLFHWIVEHPTEPRVMLSRALLLLIESHKQEAKRARLAIEAGEGTPSDGLEELRDSNKAEASELAAVVRDVGIDERIPQRSEVVASLHRALRVNAFPTMGYRIGSAFTHFEPLVLFNSLDYEWQTNEGQWYRTMSVTGLLTPLVMVYLVLRRAGEAAANLFEFTIGASPFDEMGSQLRQAYVDHGQEQGADLRIR